ncbi:MAG TPA: ABC transporter transmembrane domain-containing protein, partial [Tepidisphaeraceae bacterium]|nr:ABC transporter transmembrane domain-containing protein [Tepidisphaeraceae bacterium]
MTTQTAVLLPIAASAEIAPANELSTAYLLKWMFRFLAPVKMLVILACCYLSMWVAAEVLAIRQSGEAINHISTLHVSFTADKPGLLAWITSTDPDAVKLRHLTLVLVGLVIAYATLRYLKEVSGVKLSMTMVYYIREAIYDKLQRVGFGFHDAMSTGQLINRALSDLQNVRAFIQTAVLVSLEILLMVFLSLLLVLERNPWLAILSLAPLPLWTWYILRFSRVVQP